MHAENFLINKSCNWQAVKYIGEYFPKFDRVPSLAFVVKSINSVDLGAFVVTSEEEEVLRVLDLVAHHQSNSFDRLFASVNVVTQE